MGKAFARDHLQIALSRRQEAAARLSYGGIHGLREIPKPEPIAARGGAWSCPTYPATE
jgi:hypothetical protein